MNMKRVYIKPVTEDLHCDNGLMLCSSNSSNVSQGIGYDDDTSGDQEIITDPNKDPFDD